MLHIQSHLLALLTGLVHAASPFPWGAGFETCQHHFLAVFFYIFFSRWFGSVQGGRGIALVLARCSGSDHNIRTCPMLMVSILLSYYHIQFVI